MGSAAGGVSDYQSGGRSERRPSRRQLTPEFYIPVVALVPLRHPQMCGLQGGWGATGTKIKEKIVMEKKEKPKNVESEVAVGDKDDEVVVEKGVRGLADLVGKEARVVVERVPMALRSRGAKVAEVGTGESEPEGGRRLWRGRSSSPSSEDDVPAPEPPKMAAAVRSRRASSTQQRDKMGRFLKAPAVQAAIAEDRELVADSEVSFASAASVTSGHEDEAAPTTARAKAKKAKKKTAKPTAEEVRRQECIDQAVDEAVRLRGPTVAALHQRVETEVQAILEVAAKSTRLKGTFQKALKDAAAAISEASSMMQASSISDETKKLQADNDRLRKEYVELRAEVAALRTELARSRPQQPTPVPAASTSDAGSVAAVVMAAVEEKFAELERRLRPQPNERAAACVVGAKGPPQPLRAQAAAPVPSARASRRGKGRRVAQEPVQELPAVSAGGPQEARAPAATSTSWAKVVGRKAPKKKAGPPKTTKPAQKGSKRAKNKEAPRNPQLRTPRTAAVVLTLQSEAKEKGVTYAAVMASAKAKVDLQALGIQSLRYRTAATGARVLEIPGATSGDKAEALADRLRESLGPDQVRVSVPARSAELRISGLDESVAAAEVTAAICKATGCAEGAIKAGEVRFALSGLGAVWVRCPIATAKTLAESGRLLVGWVNARVEILPPKPPRCFRCLKAGHMAPRCDSEVDRSTFCYRCSQPGHKARQCAAKPHCGVCAEARRPADHVVGNKACKAPPAKKKAKPAPKGDKAPDAAQLVETASQVEEMVTGNGP